MATAATISETWRQLNQFEIAQIVRRVVLAQPPLVGTGVHEHHGHRTHRVEQQLFHRDPATHRWQTPYIGAGARRLAATREPQRQVSEHEIENDAEHDDGAGGPAQRPPARPVPSAVSILKTGQR